MELTTIRELFKDRESYLGKKVTIGGWVRSLRDSKTFGFIVVNDGSYFEPLQIVYHDEMENFAEVSKLNVGAAIIVKGTLVATPQAKQPFEIQADEVQIEGASASDYPLQKKRHTFEYLRTISHLRPRTNTFQAVFRVRSLAGCISRFPMLTVRGEHWKNYTMREKSARSESPTFMPIVWSILRLSTASNLWSIRWKRIFSISKKI